MTVFQVDSLKLFEHEEINRHNLVSLDINTLYNANYGQDGFYTAMQVIVLWYARKFIVCACPIEERGNAIGAVQSHSIDYHPFAFLRRAGYSSDFLATSLPF